MAKIVDIGAVSSTFGTVNDKSAYQGLFWRCLGLKVLYLDHFYLLGHVCGCFAIELGGSGRPLSFLFKIYCLGNKNVD